MDRECRTFTFELRAADESKDNKKIVRGYATTFDAPYTLYADKDYQIREVMKRTAFDNVDFSDVIMQYDHQGRVFARTRNGTLKIKVNSRGLFIEADLSKTKNGRELYEEIKGGFTNKMSIGFKADKSMDVWKRTEENGQIIETRIINRITELFDVSAVSIPANENTIITA